MWNITSLPDGPVFTTSLVKREERGMSSYRVSQGRGRTKVKLLAHYVGSNLVVYIYNENAHLGAVAVGDYDHEEKRASSSVITLRGHRDDEIAKKQAHLIARHTKKPVCVIAGIHLDDITQDEIVKILGEVDKMVLRFLDRIPAPQ